MKCILPALLTGVVVGVASNAQPVRLELRLVPQEGLLPGPITDVPAPALITGAGQVRRFELQYRILDLDLTDAIVPAGLNAAQLNITMEPAGFGTIDRAFLSRFESQQAAAIPPTPVDSSGVAGIALSSGLHRPFRGAIPAPSPNNDYVANGTVTPTGILVITPLTLSPSDQGNVNAGFDNQAWYGLYSFNWTSDTAVPAGGVLNFRAETIPDSMTGNRFAYFRDGNPVPIIGQEASGATAQVQWVPAPSSLPALLMAGGAIGIRRRRK